MNAWVRTEYCLKPGPGNDWCAWIDGEEEAFTVYGPTELEAVKSLLDEVCEVLYSRPPTTRCEQCGAIKEVIR